MTAEIKYTVKYHPRPIRKVASVLLLFGAALLLLCNLIWSPLRSLPAELQALTIFHVLPKMFFDLNNVSFLILGVGSLLWLFRWRRGKIELTDEKLIIDGSYHVSIWLRNMWEVDVRDLKYHRWRIRLDSKTDAVEIKFGTEKEFEDFSEKLVYFVRHVENVKLKTTA